MNIINSPNFDQTLNPDIIGDNDFENDDLITFQHDSKEINLLIFQTHQRFVFDDRCC